MLPSNRLGPRSVNRVLAWLATALLAAAMALSTPLRAAHAADSTQPNNSNSVVHPSSTVAGPPTPLNDASAEDIRDIRGPKFVFPAWIILALIVGAIALAIALYAVWRWRRRRRPMRPLLPFEIALQRLEEIRGLMQPARVREFSIAITDIVRAYIEQRFDVTATHRTTEEFLHDLLNSSQTKLASHRDLLAEFLQQCDLAKFAGMSLSVRHMESLHDSARAFVLETAKPDVAPDGVAATQAGAPRTKEQNATLPAA